MRPSSLNGPELERVLAVSLTQAVRRLLPAAAAVHVAFAVFYALTLPSVIAPALATLSAVAAFLSLLLWHWSRNWATADVRIHLIASLVSFLVAAKSLAHVWVTGSPTAMGSLVFLLILAGCIFYKLSHLYALIAFVAFGLTVCAARSADSADWVYLGSIVATSAVVGVVVQGARLRTQAELHSLHNEVMRQALHDLLTGLASRSLLVERLQDCFERPDRDPSRHFAVCYLDLDGFKNVNDAFGHEFGDAVLSAVGKRLRRSLTSTEFAARIGGDEFVVLSENIESEASASAFAARMGEVISGNVDYRERTIPIEASFGYAWSGKGFDSPAEIIAAADRAMYRHKQSLYLDAPMRIEQSLAALSRAASVREAVVQIPRKTA